MKHFIALTVAAGFLAGCSTSGHDELQQWMTQVRSTLQPVVPKLQEPTRFTPYLYSAQAQIDPFNITKVTVAIAKAASRGGGGMQPDMDRRREPLESFPLDTIKMVGSIERNKIRYALLQVDNVLYQVKVSNYIGQNFGMITAVTETDVTLRELVQDAAGDWVERTSTLELQETKK